MNGGEDEPGSHKDRLLMENVPHLLLDGIILAAYAVQAEKAYLYINHGYEAATAAVETAMRDAREAGYWSDDIAGSGFSLELVTVAAPSNYVAGEDTAALEVIEGREPLPRPKPPFPVTEGLFGKPSLVNNVETLANIAPIVARGPEWFRSFGTGESPGTMIFSLGEEMERPGVYELPLGTPCAPPGRMRRRREGRQAHQGHSPRGAVIGIPAPGQPRPAAGPRFPARGGIVHRVRRGQGAHRRRLGVG